MDSSKTPIEESIAIQAAASSLGFDWPNIRGVIDKAREELGEVESAIQEGDEEHARRELGDVLFALMNLARFLDSDPAEELRRANDRFATRFALLKEEVQRDGRAITDCSFEELNAVWERVKGRTSEQEKRA